MRLRIGDNQRAIRLASTTAMVTVAFLLGCGQEDAVQPDTTAPAPIGDLSAETTSNVAVTLAWTATGDDRATGTAARYDIRYSTDETDLMTPGGWDASSEVANAPTPASAGSPQRVVADGLTASTTYHFAIDVVDGAGNHSGISNIAEVTTKPPPSPLVVAADVCIVAGFTNAIDLGSDLTCRSGASVRLSAAGSLDPDGESLVYEWKDEVDFQDGLGRQSSADWAPDGIVVTSEEAITVNIHTIALHYVTLTVKTAAGREASHILRVTVVSDDQQNEFVCRPPFAQHPDQKLALCSPTSSAIDVRIVPLGVEMTFPAPQRDQTTYVSDVVSPGDGAWGGLLAGEVVPGVTVSGTYMGVLDQRIELTILQVGADEDSGVVGIDPIRIGWSSIFQSNESGEFILDDTNVGIPLQLRIEDPMGGAPDTTNVAGLRVVFETGRLVHKGWAAVFDIEDFDGFYVWRWRSDPTLGSVSVASYNKYANSARPDDAWPDATPFDNQFTVLDRFVIAGNVYHYAIQPFDLGFNGQNGRPSNAGPFQGPLPLATAVDQPGPTQIRIAFRRCP